MMDVIKHAEMRDSILLAVKTQAIATGSLANTLGVSSALVGYLVEEMAEHQLVTLVPVAGSSGHDEYFVRATNKGIYFLEFDGGYRNRVKDEKLKKWWNLAKIIAVVANAIVILVLTYLATVK